MFDLVVQDQGFALYGDEYFIQDLCIQVSEGLVLRIAELITAMRTPV